jgi:hypothetical protein
LSGPIGTHEKNGQEYRNELHIAAHAWSNSGSLYVSCWRATADSFTDESEAQENSSWEPIWADMTSLGNIIEIKKTILSGAMTAGFITQEEVKAILNFGFKI